MTAPNNPYPTAAHHSLVDPAVVRSIRQASLSTGGDFGLMMAQASQESGFHADAKATGSSATGLYQFVESTWLDMVQRFGAKYGAGALAQHISTDDNGRATVDSATVRQQILDLRKDPQISAALAGEYNNLNRTEVEGALGHAVGRAELYMAHFLGAGGATTFLKAVEHGGSTVAAQLLPEAAAANHAVFYDSETGAPRTVSQIYSAMANRIEHEASLFGGASPAAQSSADSSDPSAARSALTEFAVGSASPSSAVGMSTWNSGRLSAPLAAMINVMTLAALKLVSGEPAEETPTLPPAPAHPHARST